MTHLMPSCLKNAYCGRGAWWNSSALRCLSYLINSFLTGMDREACCCCCCCCYVASVVSDSVRPHRRQPTRFPHPWDSPGKNTGMGCHFLLLACCNSWGRKESDMTDWTELNRENIWLKISRGALFLPPSDVYVRSFLYLFYTLIKLYHIKALSSQASSLAQDWIPLL